MFLPKYCHVGSTPAKGAKIPTPSLSAHSGHRDAMYAIDNRDPVDAPAARGPRRATVERVAADLTDQQALQQGRLLGVPGGEAPILVEAFLGERELSRSDQRRHGNLDPFRARAWT